MPTIPPIDLKCRACLAPHVVILGAGASVAAFPSGDANGKALPLMSNLVQILGLKATMEKHGISGEIADFEAFYDGLIASGMNPVLTTEIEQSIQNYFSQLKLPEEVTLYDQLLLSLREKDVIATFNWDPFLAQAYRRNAHIKRLPLLAFLHGNVEVGTCVMHRQKGWIFQQCPECKKELQRSRLLYPVRRKDYNTDGFIKNEWDMLRASMGSAYFITIIGYSAPTADIEAKRLMLDQWRDNPIRWLAQIEIVDLKPRHELEATWRDFLATADDRRNVAISKSVFDTQAFRYVRRSCDALAMATLQQDPFSENPFPFTNDLKKLHAWLEPLVQEEEVKRFSGNRIPELGARPLHLLNQ